MKPKLAAYYKVTKPGIIRGNIIVAVAGFLLASKGDVDLRLIIGMMLGLSLVIASACVFNNVIDRNIDRKMKRTNKRALVTGFITPKNAQIYASVLLIGGIFTLLLFTNVLATAIAILGHIAYVIFYGYTKRHSVYGTEVGSISGAIPPVVGYASVTGSVDIAAFLLFMILIAWQMPHFYAIALYKKEDYAAAKIPVLPIVKGEQRTKKYMIVYILAFLVLSLLLTVFGYAGYTYASIMLLISIYWLWYAVQGFKAINVEVWAKKTFKVSLITILVFSLMLSIDAPLP